MFPSVLDVEARRGEQVDEAVGVVQTGAPERTLRFEVSGEAAGFVSIVDISDGAPVDTVTALDGVPTYVTVRIAPGSDAPGGVNRALVTVTAEGGEIALGAELTVDIDVHGELDVDSRLIGAAATAETVEQGRPLRVALDIDVGGSTPLEPIVTARLTGPDGVDVDLEARPAAPAGSGPQRLEVAWPTDGWAVGVHRGEVALASQGIDLGTAPIELEITPPGTATAAVTLLRVALSSDAAPDGVAKVVATVRNDGTTDQRTVFAGDLLYGTEVVAPLRSDSLLVAPGETADLAVYADLGGSGTYGVRGRAIAEGVESGIVGIEFEVSEPSSGLVRWLVIGGIAAAAAVALALTVGFASRRGRTGTRV